MNINPKEKQVQKQQSQQALGSMQEIKNISMEQQRESQENSFENNVLKSLGYEQKALQVFSQHLNAQSIAGRKFAERSIHFSSLNDASKEFIIDTKAVIQAILSYGSESEHNASKWFSDFVLQRVARGPDFMVSRNDYATYSNSAVKGYQVRLSHTVAGPITARAKLIASLTVKRDVYDMRHFIMALLHQPDTKWLETGINLSEEGVIALRKDIAERVIANPERGESKTVWQALVTTPPEELPKNSGVRPSPKRAAKTARPAPKQTESLPIHTDDPATMDLLGRKGFATILADRIIEARIRVQTEAASLTDDDDNRAFIVHMHGPWGSGKSTVLNFIRTRLEGETRPWLVVEFNAWRSQRISPPWWSLILAVQKAALKRADIGFFEKRWLALRWHWMRARADYVPMLKGIALLALALVFAGVFFTSGDDAISAVNAKAGQNGLLGSTKEVLASIAAVGTAIGGILTFGRSLLFGGGSAAKAYETLQADPYTPMMTLFCRLVHAIDRPIIVFIDDLDRCERTYVCELLENVQTMLRAAPITYLVAADRKWITTSFEKRYSDFSALGDDIGRPLGYQFLDKLFQVSATLPIVPENLHKQFWNSLLKPATSGGQAAISDAEISTQAQAAVANADSLEDLQAAAKAESNPVIQQAIRAEGARKMASDEVRAETEHRLERFSSLIESNPRAMKRLANAVGMNLARAQIEGRDSVSFEAVARWTIIELRWPILADWLSENPTMISKRPTAGDPEIKTGISALLSNARVKAVIGGARDQGRLTAKTIADLIA